MPWPGLQTTLWIRKFEVPGPIEMQSSPVLIMEFKIWNLDECCTWIPSVFKLFPGAKTFSLSNFTLLHPLNTMWNIWLFIEVSHLITMFFELENSIVCKKKKKNIYIMNIFLIIIIELNPVIWRSWLSGLLNASFRTNYWVFEFSGAE